MNCLHLNTVDVENRFWGVVAKICTDCDADLPANFKRVEWHKGAFRETIFGGVVAYWTDTASYGR